MEFIKKTSNKFLSAHGTYDDPSRQRSRVAVEKKQKPVKHSQKECRELTQSRGLQVYIRKVGQRYRLFYTVVRPGNDPEFTSHIIFSWNKLFTLLNEMQ